mgnify:FL=1
MDENLIRDKFIKGYDCSQVVLAYFAERLGITEEMANKVTACFGGGMMQGDTCGAFTGALMAIGVKYGHWDEEILLTQKDGMMAKYAEFRNLYFQRYDTCRCKELLGYDVSVPEQLQEALSNGRMLDFCPKVVKNVIEVLEEVL